MQVLMKEFTLLHVGHARHKSCLQLFLVASTLSNPPASPSKDPGGKIPNTSYNYSLKQNKFNGGKKV